MEKVRAILFVTLIAGLSLVFTGCPNPAGSDGDGGQVDDGDEDIQDDDQVVELQGKLTYLSDLGDTDDTALSGLYSVLFARDGDTPLAFASGYNESGITSLSIDATETITAVDTVFDDGETAIRGPGYLDIVSAGSSKFLLIPDYNDNGLAVLKIASDGSLNHAFSLFDDETTNLVDVWAVAAVSIEGSDLLLSGSFATDGLGVFTISESGELSYVGGLGDTEELALGEIWQIEVFEAHGKVYVAPASGADEAVSLFTVNSAGTLTETDTLLGDADMYTQETYALRHARVGTSEFLLSISYGETGGVSVLSIDPEGKLTSAFDLADSSTTGLTYLTDGRIIQRDDTAYLLTLSYEEGMTLFEIGSDGVLHLRDWLPADAGSALLYGWSFDLYEDDDGTFIAIVGGFNDQVGLVRID
jgi:6-phosphogluconolactonase (cycloisomerase 2 family)